MLAVARNALVCAATKAAAKLVVKQGQVQVVAPKTKGRYTLTLTVNGSRLIKVVIVVR